MRLVDIINAGSGCLPDGSCFFTMTVPTKPKKVEAGGPGSGRHPSGMTARELNKELDRIHDKQIAHANEMIKQGRGNELPSETLTKSDDLSKQAQDLYNRKSAILYEIHQRFGPNEHRAIVRQSKTIRGGGPGSGRHKGTLTHDPAAKEFEVRAPEGHTFSGGERSHIFTYGNEGAEHKTMREAREHANKWVNHNFVPDTDTEDEEKWKKTSVGTPKEPKLNYTKEQLEEFKKKHNIEGSAVKLGSPLDGLPKLLSIDFDPFQKPPRVPVRERTRHYPHRFASLTKD